jgi:hypothetical protein
MFVVFAVSGLTMAQTPRSAKFHLEDASIADIQRAILSRQITSTGLVELYLKRIHAYNGTCVSEPKGILGPITTIPHVGEFWRESNDQWRPPVSSGHKWRPT